jgi:arylsulfatase
VAFTLILMFAVFLSTAAQESLPRQEQPFKGQQGRTWKDSKPDFPQPVKAPPGAPNVLLILLDDVGFGQTSTFGGPVVTPALDHLAANGLRYNRFHTTALCSPTRAALLTGRNHHAVGAGIITELATGYPGYHNLLPKSAATIAEVLRQNGYNTSAYGKWHNTPDSETSLAGPFDRWPTGLGFEYFYGFFGGDTSQWDPDLVENTSRIEKPRDQKDYHLTTAMADKAIAWMRQQKTIAPDKPFFVYFAPGATHAPHHAPQEWVDKYKGKFNRGWDKLREEVFARQKQLGVIPANAVLTPRPASLPAWDWLNADQKRLYARMMEIYAGFLAHTDAQVGRVIEAIAQLGVMDNTLIIYIVGDNGASGEGGLHGSVNELKLFNGIPDTMEANLARIEQLGGPLTFNHYPAGWAHAGSTPFPWVKQVASHFGGMRNPVVISWPQRIKDKGGLRTQFHHVIDVVPTILEAAGIQAPRGVNGIPQQPLDGVSMAYTFDDAKAKGRRVTQYFELLGNRGIYHDGWMASAFRGRLPWAAAAQSKEFDDDEWELYNLEEDFSQSNNLAAKDPKKLRALQDIFWIEAAKNNVLPLDDRTIARFDVSSRPSLMADRQSFTFYPGLLRLPEGSAPDLKNKSHSITISADIPAAGAEGVLVTQGGRFGGYGLFIQNGKLTYIYNLAMEKTWTITSSDKVPAGKVTLRYEFTYDGGGAGRGGIGRLFINGKPVGEGRIERTLPFRLSLSESFDVGEDTGTPMTESYQTPFRFSGTIHQVRVDLGK